jgi:hypothetical protein
MLGFDPTGTTIYEEPFIEPLAAEGGNVRVPSTPGLDFRRWRSTGRSGVKDSRAMEGPENGCVGR